jgi:hypothetical protein
MNFRGMTVITLLVCGLASATALGDLAAQMSAGEWRELATTNLVPVIKSEGGGAVGNILPYAEDAAWDPGTESFYYIGSDHQHSTGYAKFICYSAESNTWREMPRPSWFGPITSSAMHGYDHNAIDARNGVLYFMQYCCSPSARKYDIKTATWTQLPYYNMGYQHAGGLEYFPEIGGLIYATDNGGGDVYFYNAFTNRWSTLASDLTMGGHHNFAEYNPVHKVMIFGGGNSSRVVYKMDTTGRVTRMNDAPFVLRVNQAIVSVDPVSGDFLVLGGTGQFYVFDVMQNTWTQKSASTPLTAAPNYQDDPIFCKIAAPVSTYGVNMFVEYISSSQGKVFIYKHSSGSTGVKTAAAPTTQGLIETWPNPARSAFSFRAPAGAGLALLFDVRGRLARKIPLDADRVMTVKGLERGVYMLRIETESVRTVKRLTIL